MIWLLTQMAVIMLIVALLAGAVGFWVRGWIVADERAAERYRWQRELREAKQQHGITDLDSERIADQLRQLQSDYQDLLTNERRLYNELDALKAELDDPRSATAVKPLTPEESIVIQVGASWNEPHNTPVDAAEEAPAPDLTRSFLEAPQGNPDNLRKIRGIGPKLANQLNGLGIYHFWQIAEWSDKEIAEVASHIKGFAGRIERDGWIEQAKRLR